STDGDGDRPLIGDEHGNWMRGDVVGILTAHYLEATDVVTPVSSNTSLELSGIFANTLRTRIGSPYVIEAMKCMLDENRRVVGFEANGGFLLGSTIKKSSHLLLPLMTRDAILPMLALLAMARETGRRLSELPKKLPNRFTSSDRLQSFPTESSFHFIEKLSSDNEAIEGLLGQVCGKPSKVDRTDGIRITFMNGEIVHFRPSGNAPELRCYAEASSQVRADNLSHQSLQMIKAQYTK
ncbi:MAG: phosphomannomutase, partial [Methylophilaceae bacterium]